MKRLLVCAAGLIIIASRANAQAPSIEHSPVACAVAGRFPRMEARFTPAEKVAAARVLFQGENVKEWYAVAMKAEGAAFSGVLPQPKKSLKSFRYYIEVTDKDVGASRTPEYTTAVVDSAGACRGMVAATLASASVLIQGPAGALVLPAGFASTGVVAAGTAAGSGTAVGATGAGTGAGGGIGTTALVVGGVAVAGGVAVGVSKAGGGDSADSGSTGPGTSNSGPVGAAYNIIFLPSPPGIDVSVCAGRSLTWGSQAISGLDASGNFNLTWAPNEPNTLRISGQLTATSFQATLACVSGAQTGSISASGSNYSLTGSFAFGNSRGQVSITKQ